jgi:hypothetical protein
MPPLAVPSSLVSTMPVMPTTCAKTSAWPQTVLACCGVEDEEDLIDRGLCFSTTRLILPSSSMRPTLFWKRPAVSMQDDVDFVLDAAALTASKATAAGSAPSRAERTVGTPTRAPHVSSWSAAAARKVSAAPRTTSLSSRDEDAGELADGRGLAGAVDPDDEDARGPAVDTARRDRHGPWTGRPGSAGPARSQSTDGGLGVGRAVDGDRDVRSESTSSVVAARHPGQRARRVSSTSSQSSSESLPPERRARRFLPRALLELGRGVPAAGAGARPGHRDARAWGWGPARG